MGEPEAAVCSACDGPLEQGCYFRCLASKPHPPAATCCAPDGCTAESKWSGRCPEHYWRMVAGSEPGRPGYGEPLVHPPAEEDEDNGDKFFDVAYALVAGRKRGMASARNISRQLAAVERETVARCVAAANARAGVLDAAATFSSSRGHDLVAQSELERSSEMRRFADWLEREFK